MYRRIRGSWMENMDFRLIDLLCLQAAFWVACAVRHKSIAICFSELYLRINFLMLIFSFLLGILLPTFTDIFRRGFYKEFVATLRQVVFLLLLCSFYFFLAKEAEDVSRASMVLFGLLYLPYSYSLRVLHKYNRQKRGYSNIGQQSLFIITIRDNAEKIINNLRKTCSGDYKITGIALMDADVAEGEIKGIPVLATQSTIIEYICHEWIDTAFVCVPNSFEWKEPVIDSLIEMGVTTRLKLTSVKHKADNQQYVEEFAGYTVLTNTVSRGSMVQILLKRMMDIAGGVVGCLLTGILAIFIGPVILILSPGPIFFKQIRVGRNGKQFKIYKFRSMYMDAEERKKELSAQNAVKDGMMFKIENDPRIIGSEKGPGKGFGNFIRKYSLDEFPQFFNVLKGDMSLVGTRPPTVEEWNKYALRHRGRLAIKPGLTGMWQVSGRSRITDFEEVVRLDKEYIRNWNIGMDIKILFKTVLVVFRKDGSM